VTSKPPGEIQALIDTHVTSSNAQSREGFRSVFRDTSVIIDGIASYRWLNPNAPEHCWMMSRSGARRTA
jgi:hypothetical protein